MKGFVENIENLTKENNNFRRVIYTGKNSQLVLMSLEPGEEIGAEVHGEHDQFFRIEVGQANVTIDGNEYDAKEDDAVIVPAGAEHNVTNTGNVSLKLYTIYSPPEHKDEVTHNTKEDAEKDDEHFDGNTTE